MPALTVTVDTAGGGDYSSLNAAESAEQQNLTDGAGDTWTATCTVGSGSAADTTAVTFSGWTTGATTFIEIVAATAERAVASGYSTSNYRLDATDAHSLTMNEEYMRVDGLQIQQIFSASSRACIRQSSGVAAQLKRIRNCYCVTSGGGSPLGYSGADTDLVLEMWNCIFHDLGGSDGLNVGAPASADFWNCIVHNTAVDGIQFTGGTGEIINCAIFNNGDDFDIAGGATVTIDFCASDDNDGTNNVAESGGGASWPSDYVDAANGDFTLLTGSGLVGNGTDDPGSGLFSDDMNRDTRTSTWDVGADEFVVAAADVILLPLDYQPYLAR